MISIKTFSVVTTAAMAIAAGSAFAACEGVKLYDVSGGSFVVDSNLKSAWSMEVGTPWSLVVPQQIIEHPRGLVLFDTGLADDVADGGCEAHWGEGMCQYLQPQWTRDDVIDRKLQKLGFSTDMVKYVIYSHFHVDHAGNLELFPKATHVVQKIELRHAWWPDKYFRGSFVLKDYDDARDFDYLELTGDFDLFGDGCVRILSTPGHTPGHQSLLVRLPKTGSVILTGDAVVSADNLTGTPPGYTQNLTQSLDSIERIKMIRDAEQADVWITHDMEQYEGRRHDEAYE